MLCKVDLAVKGSCVKTSSLCVAFVKLFDRPYSNVQLFVMNDLLWVFTAFNATGQLYQITQFPFGLKNAVHCFQRAIGAIIREHDCKSKLDYLDDESICGKLHEEHNKYLKRLLEAANSCGL